MNVGAATVEARSASRAAAAELVVLAATALEMAPLATALGAATPGEGADVHDHDTPVWPPTSELSVGGRRVRLVVTGIGKANTAAALAATCTPARGLAAADRPPPRVLQFGVAGAYPGSGLSPTAVAVARSERDLDLGPSVGTGDGERVGLEAIGIPLLPGTGSFDRLELGGPLAELVAEQLEAPLVDFATSDGITSSPQLAAATSERWGVAVESMEGFAAAQVARALGLEFVEVRSVSNRVGDRDKANWRLAEAVAVAAAAAHRALALL